MPATPAPAANFHFGEHMIAAEFGVHTPIAPDDTPIAIEGTMWHLGGGAMVAYRTFPHGNVWQLWDDAQGNGVWRVDIPAKAPAAVLLAALKALAASV